MDDLDAGQVGQLQVEYHDVGSRGRGHPYRLPALADGGHHLVALLGELARHTLAPHRVVVDDHHAGHAGTRNSTSVP